MKKRIWLFPLLILASLLLTGCALQTVDEMYALPKRSKEYDSLQSAIDSAMYGLSYSAPVSGENQQTVQMADLDGDGVEELRFPTDRSPRDLVLDELGDAIRGRAMALHDGQWGLANLEVCLAAIESSERATEMDLKEQRAVPV